MCLELWKLTLTGQFAGISLRTRSGINYRTIPKAFFALSPWNLPPCQLSLSKEVVLGAQQNPLIVLVGCQQTCSKSWQSSWETIWAGRHLQEAKQSSKVTLVKKCGNDKGCETTVSKSTSHLWSLGIVTTPYCPLTEYGLHYNQHSSSFVIIFDSVFGCSPIFLSAF